MSQISIIHHIKGSPGFRLLGLGPNLYPCQAISQLQYLFNENSFWGIKRKKKDLIKMLANSDLAISMWNKRELIGFGRATTDSIYRATLWDIIVSQKLQNQGNGKLIVNSLLNTAQLMNVEKIYLMTTKHKEFYENCGFKLNTKQNLMIIDRNHSC